MAAGNDRESFRLALLHLCIIASGEVWGDMTARWIVSLRAATVGARQASIWSMASVSCARLRTWKMSLQQGW